MNCETEAEIVWTCEWCEPSEFVSTNPEDCRLMNCSKHGGMVKYWHWPKPKP